MSSRHTGIAGLVVVIGLTGCMHPRAPPAGAAPEVNAPAQTAPAAHAPAAPTAPAATPVAPGAAPTTPTTKAAGTASAAPATTASARPRPAPPAHPVTTPNAASDGVGAASNTSRTTRTGGATPAPATPPPTLNLTSLEDRLRETHAIGVFTKLSLKNQVDDLLSQVRAFHQGQSKSTLPQLRQSYEVLLLKVVSLLQSGDPQLASAVSTSRDAIWALLADPKKFAEISFRYIPKESSCAGGYRFYC